MRLWGSVAAVAVAGVAMWLAATGWGEGGGGASAPPEIVSEVGSRPVRSTEGKKACTEVDEPANFRLFSVGSGFEGMPLTTVMRVCSAPYPLSDDSEGLLRTWRANSVSYVYGHCELPEGEGGCATPLELQIWPACERHPALGEHRPRLTRRRGVPTSGRGGTIEVYTADSTAVVFARDAGLAERAVEALQPMARDRAPAALPPKLDAAARLPAPVPGAVTGELSCSR